MAELLQTFQMGEQREYQLHINEGATRLIGDAEFNPCRKVNRPPIHLLLSRENVQNRRLLWVCHFHSAALLRQSVEQHGHVPGRLSPRLCAWWMPACTA